jgi:two-component system chemotaxis response regulator CheB
MIDVLIVDDSPVARQLIDHILVADPNLRVVGTAASGEEAVESVARLKPDVVTMDIHMPGMNGFDATRKIMESNPVPIVIISGSYEHGEVDKAFRAMDEGALAILGRPVGLADPRYAQQAREIRQSVRLMAEVGVVRRTCRVARAASIPCSDRLASERAVAVRELVAIGASTGGPPVIQTILAGLPKDFRVPLVIVQHMAAGFVKGMVDWLNATSGVPVHLARHGEEALPGHAYVAPDALQMGVDAARRIVMQDAPPEHGVRPSASYLFRSVADGFGSRAVGVLLTGMGKDGASELNSMRMRGAATIVQSRETCVVFGMPGEAVRLGAAMDELPPDEIPAALVARVRGGGIPPAESRPAYRSK